MARNRLWFALFTLFALLNLASAQRPTPGLKLVGKDYQNTIQATDRNWFYKDSSGNPLPGGGGGQYPNIELNPLQPNLQINKIVDLKGDSFNISLTFQNQATIPFTGSLVPISAKLIIGPGNEVPLNLSGGGSFSMGAYPATGTSSINLTGLPSYVTKGELFIQFEVHGNVGIQVAGQNYILSYASNDVWATLYLTDQTPTGHQTVPWTDLLDYSCTWAHGSVGKSQVSWDLTFATYWMSPINYTQYSQGYFENLSGDNYRYNLKNVLNNFALAGYTEMDCTDISGFLHQLIQSQGYSPTILRMNFDTGTDMVTNYLCPLGSDATNLTAYQPFQFYGHQILLLSGAIDATLAQYKTPSGANYYNPPFGWSYNNYVQSFPGSYPSPIYGFYFSYTPGAPTWPEPSTILPGTSTAILTEIR